MAEINEEFVTASFKGDKTTLKSMLKNGVYINSIDRIGRTALYAATQSKNAELVRWLLENGADVDYFDPKINTIEKTAFLYAGANGLNDILDVLIEYNPNVSIVNGYGGTALIPACERGHIETVRKLIQKTEMDINHVNNLGWTALLEAIILSNGGKKHQEIVRILLENKADPSIPDRDGVTPLEHARNKGYKEIEKILLEF